MSKLVEAGSSTFKNSQDPVRRKVWEYAMAHREASDCCVHVGSLVEQQYKLSYANEKSNERLNRLEGIFENKKQANASALIT